MKKYSQKKEIKSKGITSRIFSIFYDLFYGEKIEKSFKSLVMALKGKSHKEIEQHFKKEEIIRETLLREEARERLNL